jgi:hypothetical protein
LAASDPEAAVGQAKELRSGELRGRIERLAFLTAAGRRDSAVVGRLLPRLLDRDWIGEAPIERAAEAGNRVFALACARHNPAVAIRESARYARLPFAQEVFDEAARLLPEEAVLVATGNSPAGERVRAALAGSPDPALRRLGALAADRSIPEADRPKVAWLIETTERSRALLNVRRDPEYFGSLVDLRLRAEGLRARWLDRTIEQFALQLLRTMRDDKRAAAAAELDRFRVRDLRILAAYGRAEDTEETFAIIFDHYLIGRAAKDRTGAVAAPALGLRTFLAMALAHNRLEPFLKAVVPARADRTRLLAGAVSGVNAAVDAVTAAELVEGTTDRETLALFAGTLSSDRGRYAPLAAARLCRHLERLSFPAPERLARMAGPFLPFLTEDLALDTGAMFDAQGRCVQVQFFYDDEDGVVSYENFRAVYRADSRWKWEDRGGWWRVQSTQNGRSIELVTNVPLDDPKPEGEARRTAMLDWLRSRSAEPAAVIHRGHAYHLDKTLDRIPAGVRLVYLGSCGSAAKVHVVVERANRAQVIATRGIGTLAVNDPLLKSIHDELLASGGVRWPEFWEAQRQRFRGEKRFEEYIAPHRNEAVILLRAWEEALAAGLG